MDRKPQIAVIIPSYNSDLHIERCLTPLVAQAKDTGCEIILVDSSKDSTSDIVKNKYPSVELTHLDRQTLPGGARNVGAQAASHEILAFIDSDCIARDDWIRAIRHVMDQNHTIIGGAIENGTPKSYIGTADYFITFNEFLPRMPEREVTFLPTCNFICRKDVFEDIGGFLPDWATGEDFVFCYEASKKYKLFFSRKIVVFHINRQNFWKFLYHHYNFGKHGAMTRTKLELPGTVFTKYPLLMIFLPLVRFLRILIRIIRWNRRLLSAFILVSPLVIIGVCAWGYGFLKKVLEMN